MEQKIEKTLVLIKPDGLIRSLTGNIITTLSEKKLKILGTKIVKVSREFAEQHYDKLKQEQIAKHGEEKGTEIFENTLDFIQGKFHTDRVMAIVYSGPDAISEVKHIAGATNPEKADPTSIRGKFGRIHSETGVFENVMHCSDSKESAEREIELWFNPDEVVDFEETFKDTEKHLG